ncbi:alpha/beta fold hydrolase, partial [Streptomyces sp. B-S-A8]
MDLPSARPLLLHHEVAGPADAPPLVLGPSLGTSMALWEPQLPSLARHFRVFRFDLPGHGGSPAELLPDPAPGRTTVEDLAALVLAVADHHGLTGFHYAGVSLGGAIGAHLAVHRPERLLSLAAICSSAHFGAAQPWYERAALVRREGLAPLVGASPARWFAEPGAGVAASPFGRRLLAGLAGAQPAGYAACCDALAAYDLRDRLGRIAAPTLVVAGSHDVATPVAHARELVDGVPRAALEVIPAGHLAVEAPQALAEVLLTHLRSAAPAPAPAPVPAPGPPPPPPGGRRGGN